MAKSDKPKSFIARKPAKQVQNHTGKGTRARLNTAAEKMMFGTRSSD